MGGEHRRMLLVLMCFGGLHQPVRRLMLCWKHCSPTCQFSFIYNHRPGSTPINVSCRISLITEIRTQNKRVLMLVASVLKWNESLQLGWNWKHGGISSSPINNLKTSSGFGVLGKPNPCREGVPAGCLMLFGSCLFNFSSSILTKTGE